MQCDSAFQDEGNNPSITPNPTMMQKLHFLLKTHQYKQIRHELDRAELAEDLPEFYILDLRAILAMLEGSDLAGDYLELAEAVAASPREVAIAAEHRAAHELQRGDPFAAAKRCMVTLERIWQTEGLWNNLLIALHRLGEVDTIDATLRSFARLNEECSARLVRLLLSEPDLREVRARPAFADLLERRIVARAGE